MIEDDEELGDPIPEPREKTAEQLLKEVASKPAKSDAERREALKAVTNKLKGKFG